MDPPNTAPTCGITSPADGEAGPEGGEIRFEGTVADVDVAADWLGVTWTSDVDGTLRESTPDSDGTVGFAYTEDPAFPTRIRPIDGSSFLPTFGFSIEF